MEARLNFSTSRKLVRMCLAVALGVVISACKISVMVPAGGAVVTESAHYDCRALNTCTVEVADTGFEETFVASPAIGYQFIGWKKGYARLCGGSLAPCTIDTSWFADYDNMMDLLESDELTYLEPQFILADDIRRYKVGDVISFTGTVAVSNQAEPPRTSRVIVRQEYLPGTVSYQGKQVLTLRTITAYLETGEQQVSLQSVWQETNGALYELTDTYGNTYVVGTASEQGLLGVPVPLIPYDDVVINFYTMFGGSVTGPVTEGQRDIGVSALSTVTTPMGEYRAYPVSHTESYQYFFTYVDNKSGASIRIERDMWISPAKGLVKKIEIRRDYSRSGSLESETRLELHAIKANF